MHILVATAGALPPTSVAEFLESIWRPGFRVSVVTAVQVPREFLADAEEADWSPLFPDEIQKDDSDVITRYVTERGHRLAGPILASLEARGIRADPLYVDDHEPAAAIVQAANQIGAGLIIMGATKPLFDAATWSSISAQVVREARIPTLVMPGSGTEVPEPEEEPEG
jgi:nucleotide-binding universal stress UspA family protein